MATGTDFLPAATAVGANVDTQTNFAGAAYQTNGFSSGIALAEQANKLWRQSSIMSAAMANYISDVLNTYILDDGNLSELLANLWQALLGGGYFVDTGSANAISVSAPAGLTFGAPFAGLTIRVKIAVTNTSSTVVFNWAATGNLPVVALDAALPSPGDLPGGTIVVLMFDGLGNWRILTQTRQALKRTSFGTAVDILGSSTSAPAGNYIVPAGVYLIQPVLVGAGGGSSGSSVVTNGAIAGGGGGGVCIGAPMAVIPSQSIAYAVGAGGAAVTYGNTGGTGGTTTFAGTLSATGGTGGSYTQIGGGGAGVGGLINLQGNPGAPYADSTVGSVGGTGGGAPYLGSGGGSTGQSPAGPGGWPGGGAGGPGSTGAFAGAKGGNGAIFIFR